MKKPYNVLLITLDAMRRDYLGCYGNKYNPSPNIDRLAERSFLFENAVTSGFGTDPIHTSIFTGLSPLSHGIVHHGAAVEKDEIQDLLLVQDHFLSNILKANGYRTLAVDFLGRWHTSGFDYYSGPIENKTKRIRRRILSKITQSRLLQRLFPYPTLKMLLGSVSAYDSAESIVSRAVDIIEDTEQPFLLFLHF